MPIYNEDLWVKNNLQGKDRDVPSFWERRSFSLSEEAVVKNNLHCRKYILTQESGRLSAWAASSMPTTIFQRWEGSRWDSQVITKKRWLHVSTHLQKNSLELWWDRLLSFGVGIDQVTLYSFQRTILYPFYYPVYLLKTSDQLVPLRAVWWYQLLSS